MTKILLNSAEVSELLGVSRSSLRRLIATGKLPRPVRLSHGIVKWPVTTINDWAAKLA